MSHLVARMIETLENLRIPWKRVHLEFSAPLNADIIVITTDRREVRAKTYPPPKE